jgi:four helix bundle protein
MGGAVQDFKNLKVWEKAHRLTLEVYQATGAFPNHETFGLRSQIRRAMIAIPGNLAEGCGRGSDADFKRFVQMAMGSACEVEYFLLLARDLTYLPGSDHTRLTNDVAEVKRMLAGLLSTLEG